VRNTSLLPSLFTPACRCVHRYIIITRRNKYEFLGKSQDIVDVKNALQSSLATQSRILDSLDSLGDKMESMLQEQSGIEVRPR
jgi:hypothetical protein